MLLLFGEVKSSIMLRSTVRKIILHIFKVFFFLAPRRQAGKFPSHNSSTEHQLVIKEVLNFLEFCPKKCTQNTVLQLLDSFKRMLFLDPVWTPCLFTFCIPQVSEQVFNSITRLDGLSQLQQMLLSFESLPHASCNLQLESWKPSTCF